MKGYIQHKTGPTKTVTLKIVCQDDQCDNIKRDIKLLFLLEKKTG